jgi:hypothetical protein
MKALISSIEARESGHRVVQVNNNNQIFEVATDFYWVNFPSNLDATQVEFDIYWYDPSDQTIKEIPPKVVDDGMTLVNVELY